VDDVLGIISVVGAGEVLKSLSGWAEHAATICCTEDNDLLPKRRGPFSGERIVERHTAGSFCACGPRLVVAMSARSSKRQFQLTARQKSGEDGRKDYKT
jgi:hypothetical protein